MAGYPNLMDMPVEILVKICQFLPDHAKCELAATNWRFKRTLQHHFKINIEMAKGKRCGWCRKQIRKKREDKVVIRCIDGHSWLIHHFCWKVMRVAAIQPVASMSIFPAICPDPHCQVGCMYKGRLVVIQFGRWMKERKIKVNSNPYSPYNA